MGKPSRVRVTGPLTPHAAGYRRELVEQGYRPTPTANQLQLMAHVSRWLESQGLGVSQLSPDRVEEFLAHRRAEGYRLWLSPRAMEPLLGYLRRAGALPTMAPTGPRNKAESLQEQYRAYLVNERGLAAATVTSYLHVARLFFATRAEEDPRLDQLSAPEVTKFVLAECTSRSVGSAQYIVCGLRSLLRYLYVAGHTGSSLEAAVPRVAGWRAAALPSTLGPAEVARLLASCDRRTVRGRRDYAALTLLSRLGLRAGEVAGLRLADIDWRCGEIVVHGKGRKEGHLPLPSDVGEALAGWLQRGRPRCSCTTVFIRVRAPHRPLTKAGVSAIVEAACRRAGLPKVGAHRLRHSAATLMLRGGAGLEEVGQVLRHSSPLTTAVYAKVDHNRLRTLALPWPEVGS